MIVYRPKEAWVTKFSFVLIPRQCTDGYWRWLETLIVNRELIKSNNANESPRWEYTYYPRPTLF